MKVSAPNKSPQHVLAQVFLRRLLALLIMELKGGLFPEVHISIKCCEIKKNINEVREEKQLKVWQGFYC